MENHVNTEVLENVCRDLKLFVMESTKHCLNIRGLCLLQEKLQNIEGFYVHGFPNKVRLGRQQCSQCGSRIIGNNLPTYIYQKFQYKSSTVVHKERKSYIRF